MKTKFLALIFLFCYSIISNGQPENLNQFDTDGKKDGKWMLYLDQNGRMLKDSTKAVYCIYTYFDHGMHVNPMGSFIEKGGKIEVKENKPDPRRKIILLDGEYKCIDKKGRVNFIHMFQNGAYISYKEFFKTGEIKTYFDYLKHCEAQPNSWYLYTYHKTGKIKYEECIRKDPTTGKWPKMKG